MTEAHIRVMRCAVNLWIALGLLLTFNTIATTTGDVTLVRWSLGLTGGFAVLGVTFGIWAARQATEQPRMRVRRLALPDPRPIVEVEADCSSESTLQAPHEVRASLPAT